MSDSPSFFAELQRRHVIRAAVAHVIVAWLFIQFADVVLPYIGIVDDAVRWAFVISVATFPVTLIIAWFFEHPWHKYTGSRLAMDVIVITAVAVIAGTWAVRNIPDIVRVKTSIAVLPFEHSGGAFEQSVSRAIAYEVNSLLLKSKSINVIGFESVTSPLLAGLGTMAIANRLSVQNVLSGDVSVTDNRMRIDLRLLNSAGEALWDAVIDDSVDNLFLVQERIAVAIESRLGAGENTVPVKTVAANRCWMPNDPLALEKYYTARYYIELRTETEGSYQQIADAIEMYQQLVDDYPKFADARSGLAWAIMHQTAYDSENAMSGEERDVLVRSLAETALELCPKLGEAMHILPNQYDHENGWIGEHQQLTAFLEMQPDRTEYYQRLARHYREVGLLDRAREVAEKNYAMNPLSVKAIKILASHYLYVDRLDESSELFDLATELGNTGPNFAREMKAWRSCDPNDIDCLFKNFPPWFAAFKDGFRTIYREPANEAEAQESIDAALALFHDSNGNVVNMLNGASCDYEHLTPVFFDVWEASKKSWEENGPNNPYWHMPNVWLSACTRVWADPKFPAFAEDADLVEYWREIEFPPGFGETADGELIYEIQ